MNDEMIVDKVWLLSGVIDSAPGVLVIEDKKMTVKIIDFGTFNEKRMNEFGEIYGLENLSLRLQNGESVDFFSSDFTGKNKITFPWYYFNGGAVIHYDGKKLKLSFAQPQNTKFPTHRLPNIGVQGVALESIVSDLKHARALGKKIKSIYK